MTFTNDRCLVTATTTGTSDFTLGSARPGHVILPEKHVSYVIDASAQDEFEVGLGYVTGTTLTRVFVLVSSNSNTLVNFSAGTKLVYLTTPAFVCNQAYLHKFPVDTTYDTNQALTGSVLPENTRVLLLNQSTGSQNGIYRIDGSGNLVRPSDYYTGFGNLNCIVYSKDQNFFYTQITGDIVDTDSIAFSSERLTNAKLPSDIVVNSTITTPNTGLHILDTNASHDLIIAPGSDLSADRTLTWTTGDADRTVTISGNATISQDYSTTGTPQFDLLGIGGVSTTSTALRIIKVFSVAGATKIGVNSSATFNSTTTLAISLYSQPLLEAASYTLATVAGYYCDNPGALSGGAAITDLYGIDIRDQTRGTNNYGLRSRVSSGTNKWNLYVDGLADNHFASNIILGGTTRGTSATRTLALHTGTPPSTSPADAFQLYSADYSAGNAVPTFRTENGTVIQLNQNLTTTAAVTHAVIHTNVALGTPALSPAVNKFSQIGSITSTDVLAYSLYNFDGAANKRAGMFLDHTGNLCGFTYSASSGIPDFVIRRALTDVMRIQGSTGGVRWFNAADPSANGGAVHVLVDNTNDPTMAASTVGFYQKGNRFRFRNNAAPPASATGIIYSNTTAVGNVGTGEDDLISQTVAANTLQTNLDSIRLTWAVTFAANANNKTLKVYWNGVAVLNTGAVAYNAVQAVVEMVITRTGAATQNVIIKAIGGGIFASQVAVTTGSATLSSSVVAKLTGEATSNNDIVANQLIVEFLPAA